MLLIDLADVFELRERRSDLIARNHADVGKYLANTVKNTASRRRRLVSIMFLLFTIGLPNLKNRELASVCICVFVQRASVHAVLIYDNNNTV